MRRADTTTVKTTAAKFPRQMVLDSEKPLSVRLQAVHALLAEKLPRLARIAVAVYRDGTDTLRTLAHSSGTDNPLPHYEAILADVPSLQAIVASRQPRVLNDLPATLVSNAEHTRRLLEQGYRSSYTVPVFHHDQFFGFIFFNAYDPDFFTDENLPILGFAANVISTSLVEELDSTRILLGTIVALSEVSRLRDPETGAHLQRVSRFANLVATRLADDLGLSEEFPESVYRYAPLHDVGKLATPDTILLKPTRLDDLEREIMRQHPQKGVDIVKLILKNAATPLPHVEVLYNIILYHHEAIDGSGYPNGLAGEQIPLEARIVAVADVFDALTTTRPYKRPWANVEALTWMHERAGIQFDGACVAALASQLAAVVAIQQGFAAG